MKTNCSLRDSLHSLITGSPTNNSTTSETTTNRTVPGHIVPGSAMMSTTPTGKKTITDLPCSGSCSGTCSSCCCAVLMLHFIAECCDDPAAFAEDAQQLLMKYPLH